MEQFFADIQIGKLIKAARWPLYLTALSMPLAIFFGLILALIGLILALGVIEGGLRLYAELRAPHFVGLATPTDDTQPDPLLVAWFKPNYIAPDSGPQRP